LGYRKGDEMDIMSLGIGKRDVKLLRRRFLTDRILAVAIGDSTTAGGVCDPNGVVAAVGNSFSYPEIGIGIERAGVSSWFTYACLLSAGRLVLVHNAGVSSDTTNGMLARFQNDVIAYNPDVVFLGDAHNDFSSSIVESVTRSNIDLMVNMALNSGITPIIRLIYPENNASLAPYVIRHNNWLKKYASDNNLIVV
jgi:lysophospholipase L1-like esterase